jgi:hypothetical protein
VREKGQQVVQQLVQRARSAARVDYQPEFAPRRGSGTVQTK